MSINLARGKIEHLSYSSISTYIDCGRKFKYKYIDNLPSKASSAAAFGSAFHGVVQDLIWSNIHEAAPVISVEKLWDMHFRSHFDKLSPGAYLEDESLESFNELGLMMLQDQDLREVLRGIKPGVLDGKPAIEKQMWFRVYGVSVPILGYVDVINDEGIPYDFKTSSASWPKDRAAGELQTLFYLMALQEAGTPSPDMIFRHVVFPKTGKNRVQVFEHKHTQAELDWLREIILEYWNGIRARVFTANPSSYLCSPKWCPFWDGCRGKK